VVGGIYRRYTSHVKAAVSAVKHAVLRGALPILNQERLPDNAAGHDHNDARDTA